MAIRYSGTTIGTFTLCQKREECVDGEWKDAKDEKGRQVYNKFRIQIRQGNCMAVFLYIYKQDPPKDPKRPWVHRLVCFFDDERHLKNCMKDYTKDAFKGIFSGELRNIKLNIYYKEMMTLAKYMAKDGLKVTCYYKEPKKK